MDVSTLLLLWENAGYCDGSVASLSLHRYIIEKNPKINNEWLLTPSPDKQSVF